MAIAPNMRYIIFVLAVYRFRVQRFRVRDKDKGKEKSGLKSMLILSNNVKWGSDFQF